METDLYSFKIVIHRLLLERNLFRKSYTAIENPSFSIRLFDYPSFIIYSNRRITPEDLQSQEFIKIGTGKSTTFEANPKEIKKLLQDIPLMISFVDSGDNHLIVHAKSLIHLNIFSKDMDHYFNESQENWKRNIFLFHDEAQNLIARVDLSVSFVKRRKDTFNPLATQGTIQGYQRIEVPKASFQANPMSTQTITKKEQIIQTDSHYNWYQTAPVQRQPEEDRYFNKTQEFEKTQNVKKPSVTINDFQPTLKTIVESHYCPPVMFFSKKKQAVTTTTDNVHGNTLTQKENVMYNSQQPLATGNLKGHQRAKSAMKRETSNNFTTNFSATQDLERPQTAQPVIILNQQEQNKLATQLGLLKSNENKGGVLDLLINELIALKTGQAQSQPVEMTSPKDEENKYSPAKKLTLSKTNPEELSKFGYKIDSNPGSFSSPKITTSTSIRRNSSAKIKNKSSRELPTNIIQETKEDSAAEEEYSQDFESLSVSQNLSSVEKSKSLPGRDGQGLPVSLKGKTIDVKASTISESYPEDFEQLSSSQNISFKMDKGKKSLVNKSQSGIAEEIMMSSSFNKSVERLRGEAIKSRRDSKISEYSEDFEELSEENY